MSIAFSFPFALAAAPSNKVDRLMRLYPSYIVHKSLRLKSKVFVERIGKSSSTSSTVKSKARFKKSTQAPICMIDTRSVVRVSPYHHPWIQTINSKLRSSTVAASMTFTEDDETTLDTRPMKRRKVSSNSDGKESYSMGMRRTVFEGLQEVSTSQTLLLGKLYSKKLTLRYR